ncbi:MAG TPA: isoprenylcysteine carboxylmethyltransferase family protein [Rhizomicrobium sp.]|nr:isoprenylcysteine carboxylmethyltransferase family protein [Rhizomicrobium sp.]
MSGSVYLFAARPEWAMVFWSSFFAFLVVGTWVQNRERGRAPGEMRDRGSKAIIYLASAIGTLLAFGLPVWAPFGRIASWPEPVFVTAVVLFWAGLLLYVWSALTLGTHFRTAVQLLKEHHLVTRGPYRLLRHPAYTGGIAVFAGIGLACGNWIAAIMTPLAVALGYAWRIHVEEIALHEKFGAEFEAHRRRTWAVIPLIW